MIYVKRNDAQNIEDLQFSPSPGYEEASLFSPEIKAFVENSQNETMMRELLAKLDMDMVRVIEDVIDVMIDKELIRFTDLPEPVQNKLIFKRSLRNAMNPHISLIEEDDALHF
ncbi:hypothetical protein [Thiomicrospira sp. WB1]|uniref:hypothetical protein n=1 Tax=Thiomicrospira sp. WB1 TaxID=1685380 RepID=UPI000749AC3C|nr:hypothetical protein [Thiomicrospira sp. WB1]KUJ72287.1 hypothetical protein AVO41_00250 [Thiomicrospira sp. WB1]